MAITDQHLCFSCPLADCDDSSPQCLLRDQFTQAAIKDRDYRRTHQKTEKYKVKRKLREAKPENIARRRALHTTPEFRAKRRVYHSLPDVRHRRNLYKREQRKLAKE